MADITHSGNPIRIKGDLPAVGSAAPAFRLTTIQLADVGLEAFAGKRIVMNIFPSIDTGTCAKSVRRFKFDIDKVENAVCLCISRDLKALPVQA